MLSPLVLIANVYKRAWTGFPMVVVSTMLIQYSDTTQSSSALSSGVLHGVCLDLSH